MSALTVRVSSLRMSVRSVSCLDIFTKSHVGVVSRPGTLTGSCSSADAGWNRPDNRCRYRRRMVNGTDFIDALKAFNEDPETAVVMIGEIGGTAEEEAAEWIKENMTKGSRFIGGVTASETHGPRRRNHLRQ